MVELTKELKLDSKFITLAVVKLMKRDIFERYKKTGELTDEDWEFCETIDWHPVDELPLKDSFISELEESKKEKSIKLKSISEIFSS